MLVFNGLRQHRDFACAPWRQRKTAFGRAHVG
jgi:hypothetical protein